MDIKDMLSEGNQSQKVTYCMILFLWPLCDIPEKGKLEQQSLPGARWEGTVLYSDYGDGNMNVYGC